MQEKKVPQRKCLGCGQPFPKKNLLRVVRSPEGIISVDETGKKAGRGAYVCRKLSCLRKARKAKRLERSLECEISDDVFSELESEIAGLEKEVLPNGNG